MFMIRHNSELKIVNYYRRSRWPRGLWHGSAADRLLGLRVRISPGDMDICLLKMLYVVRLRSLRRVYQSAQCGVSDCNLET